MIRLLAAMSHSRLLLDRDGRLTCWTPFDERDVKTQDRDLYLKAAFAKWGYRRVFAQSGEQNPMIQNPESVRLQLFTMSDGGLAFRVEG